jgi:hypothetical protein
MAPKVAGLISIGYPFEAFAGVRKANPVETLVFLTPL